MNPILFLFGCRRLRADAVNAPGMLNLCLEKSIPFCDFQGGEDGSVSILCPWRGAGRIKRLADERGIAVSALEVGGLPRYLWRLKGRFGLLLGALAASLLLGLASGVVWDVRVSGNTTVSAGEVIRELDACGFGVGSRLSGVDTDALENRVLLRSDRLSWISIQLDGTVARVQVVERVEKAETPKTKPANLVAAQGGQIELLELYRGESVVHIGQAVQKGELLVSGVYDSQTRGYRYTRAAGRVLARVEHRITVEIPLQYLEKQVTEDRISEIELNFFQKKMKIFKSTGNGEGACDIIEEVNGFSKWGLQNLPISFTKYIQRYYEEIPTTRTSEQALAEAYRVLDERLAELSSDMQLLRKDISTTLTDEALILECTVLVIENIAEQVEFEVEGEP